MYYIADIGIFLVVESLNILWHFTSLFLEACVEKKD